MERIIVLIRPEAACFHVEIIQSLISQGFKVEANKHILITTTQATLHYTQESDNSTLIATLTSSDSYVLLLSRFNAFDFIKSYIGPNDYNSAKLFYPNSLRAKYATSQSHLAIEASESISHFNNDLKIFFPESFITPPTDSKTILEANVYPVLLQALTSLCKAKPANPTAWLGNWLIENNPNKPKVQI